MKMHTCDICGADISNDPYVIESRAAPKGVRDLCKRHADQIRAWRQKLEGRLHRLQKKFIESLMRKS